MQGTGNSGPAGHTPTLPFSKVCSTLLRVSHGGFGEGAGWNLVEVRLGLLHFLLQPVSARLRRVEGFGFRALGSGFRVWGLVCRVWDVLQVVTPSFFRL